MFTIQKDKVCVCWCDDADRLKAQVVSETDMVPPEYAEMADRVIAWWDKQLRAANPNEPGIDAYIKILRSDLYAQFNEDVFSVKMPISLGVDVTRGGAHAGPLAAYAFAADIDVNSPEGFEPGGCVMIVIPDAAMIAKRTYHRGNDLRSEGCDTVIKEFIYLKESNPVIPVVAMWLRDYVVECVEKDPKATTRDSFACKLGDLNELYKQVAMRLNTADFSAGAVTWEYEDFLTMLQAAKCLVPAPRSIIMHIEEKKVSILAPRTDDEVVIFEAKDA